LSLLSVVGRALDLASDISDLILNWRLVVSVALALAVVYLARYLGLALDDDAYLLAGLIGFALGILWELVDAAKRRGYI
jgi:Zn-dependent membrane protease YugP